MPGKLPKRLPVSGIRMFDRLDNITCFYTVKVWFLYRHTLCFWVVLSLTKIICKKTTAPAVRKTVLVLNTHESINVPVLVDAEGRLDSELMTVYGEETEVHGSCSVTYQNRFYMFGGKKQKRQISEVTECEVKRIGSLDFDHSEGACSDNDHEIFLCFHYRPGQ